MSLNTKWLFNLIQKIESQQFQPMTQTRTSENDLRYISILLHNSQSSKINPLTN